MRRVNVEQQTEIVPGVYEVQIKTYLIPELIKFRGRTLMYGDKYCAYESTEGTPYLKVADFVRIVKRENSHIEIIDDDAQVQEFLIEKARLTAESTSDGNL